MALQEVWQVATLIIHLDHNNAFLGFQVLHLTSAAVVLMRAFSCLTHLNLSSCLTGHCELMNPVLNIFNCLVLVLYVLRWPSCEQVQMLSVFDDQVAEMLRFASADSMCSLCSNPL